MFIVFCAAPIWFSRTDKACGVLEGFRGPCRLADDAWAARLCDEKDRDWRKRVFRRRWFAGGGDVTCGPEGCKAAYADHPGWTRRHHPPAFS
ncbi:hypothetical protein C4901_13960 [Acidiferrobacter sp. SPIII_3]|nr:hypothetical protein C4901_13960 [Acidiferrobacter sp. SPIII_3]